MIKYPGSIDTDAELPAVNDNLTEMSGESINAIRKAVIIIEKTLGINPHGSQNSLSERLSESFNPDGTIKSEALDSAGLVSLPIVNSHIGNSAGIKESKLDLDVSTQDLQNQVSSNDTEIAQLQKQLSNLILKYTNHINGVNEKHAGFHITHTLADGYGTGAGGDIGTAVDFTYGMLRAHKEEQVAIEHHASSVAYVPRATSPGETPVVVETDVQAAVEKLDFALIDDRRQHNDEAHSNGVSNDGYQYLNGQALVNDASLKLTRYQVSGIRDQVKIGLCNAATIKSKNFNPTNINTNNSRIDIDVKIGSVIRSLSIVDLHNIAYPLGVSRVTLNGIVNYFNSVFSNTASGNHFPVSAFASNDGEIVFQHNIARDDCSITIRDPGAQSAIDSLGFSDVVGVEVSRHENSAFYINGTRFTELKTVYEGGADHPSSDLVDSFDAGVLVDSSGLNLLRGDFIHIFNHTVDDEANGTYLIDSIAGTTIELIESLAFGSFDFIIYRDSFTTNSFTGSDRGSIDLLIDKDRDLITSTRASITYGSTDGVRVVGVSKNFKAQGGLKLIVDGAASLYLEDADGYTGVAQSFLPGFIGYLKLFGSDNISYVIVFVNKITIGTGFATLTISDTQSQNDNLLLGTSHIDAATNEVEFPLDKRDVGLVAENAISSSFYSNVLERDVANFHLNGFINGFEISSFTSSVLTINGGTAYVNGKWLQIPTKNVIANTATAGTYNLVLTKDGNFDIFEEGTGSSDRLSVAEIIKLSDVLLVAQVVVLSSAISRTIDARFFINDVEAKFGLTVDDRGFGVGLFRTFEAASLYAENSITGSNAEVTILSNLIVAGALVISNGIRVVALGNLTLQNNVSLSNSSSIVVYGDFVANGTGTIQLDTKASLIIHGDATFEKALSIGTNSLFAIGSEVTFDDTILLTGDYSTIKGLHSNATIAFSGTTGVSVSGEYASVSNISMSMDGATTSTARYPIIALLAGAGHFVLNDSKLSQTGTVSSANWSNVLDQARVGLFAGNGLNLGSVSIANTKFENLYYGIRLYDGTDISVDQSEFNNCHTSIRLGESSSVLVNRASIQNSKFSTVYSKYIQLFGSNLLIRGNFFHSAFSGASPDLLSLVGNEDIVCLFEENSISNILLTTGFDFTTVTGNSALNINNNLFENVESHTLVKNSGSISQVASINFTNNVVKNYIGRIFTGNCTNFSSNDIQVNDTPFGHMITFSNDPVVASEKITNSTMSNNRIVAKQAIGTNITRIVFVNGVMSDNFISCGDIIIPFSTETIVSNNMFKLFNDGILFTAIVAFGTIVVSNNNVRVFVDKKALEVRGASTGASKRMVSVVDNVFESIGNTTEVVLIGSGGNNQESWIVSGNIVQASVGKGITINAYNAVVTGNVVMNASGSSIDVLTGVQNVYINDNLVSSAISTYTNPINVFVGANKGATSLTSFPIYGSTTVGNWTIDGGSFTNAQVGSIVYIPLVLPVGSRLEQASTDIQTSPAASVNIQLRKVNGLSDSLVVSKSNEGSHGAAPLIATPSAPEYVRPSQSYYLKITSNTVGDKIGQTTVSVRY